MSTGVLQGSCALEVKDVTTLLQFQDLTLNQTATYAKPLTDKVQGFKGAEFSLFFANCADDTQVSFDITTRMYNVKGDRKDFLGVGEDALPLLYMVRVLLSPAQLLCQDCEQQSPCSVQQLPPLGTSTGISSLASIWRRSLRQSAAGSAPLHGRSGCR